MFRIAICGLLITVFLGQANSLEAPSHVDAIRARNRHLLKGFSDPVQVVSIVSENTGINAAEEKRLTAAVELHLRRCGIRVDSSDTTRFICSIKHMAPSYAVECELHEAAALIRNSEVLLCKTWQTASTAMFTKGTLERLRERALEMADEFCDDYLAANPKQP